MQQPGDAAKSAADLAAGRSSTGGSSSSCAICSTPLPTMPVRSRDGQQLGIGQGCGATGQQFFAGLGFGGQVLDGHGAGALESGWLLPGRHGAARVAGRTPQ